MPPMAWTQWQSSSSSVAERYRYDAQRALLQVRSRRSGKVRVFDCSPDLYDEFLDAPSQGRFLARLGPARSRWRIRVPQGRSERQAATGVLETEGGR